jgi:hypothetical protein
VAAVEVVGANEMETPVPAPAPLFGETEKDKPETLVPLNETVRLLGLNVYPVLLGVIV